MTVIEAFLLGFIQGATEFIPVSSSGHLVVAREFFAVSGEHGLAFDAILHFATALAIIVYFRKTWIGIAKALWRHIRHDEGSSASLTGWAVLIGTIPAGIVGFLYADYFEGVFRTSTSVAIMLILGSIALLVAEYVVRRAQEFREVTPKLGATVGLFQVIALLPGISRSGITMAGGMLAGLTREKAAEFSFLLALPIVLGAGLVGFMKMGVVSGEMLVDIIVGAGTAFLVGIAAIHVLLTFVRKHSFALFIWYRVLLAVLLLLFM